MKALSSWRGSAFLTLEARVRGERLGQASLRAVGLINDRVGFDFQEGTLSHVRGDADDGRPGRPPRE